MLRTSEILARARSQRIRATRAPEPFYPELRRPPQDQPQPQPQVLQPQPQSQAQAQVAVHPPVIPPAMPMPRDPAIYRQLMQQHDRMGTRHLSGHR